MDIQLYAPKEQETVDEYIERLLTQKAQLKLSFYKISELVDAHFGVYHGESFYRRRSKKLNAKENTEPEIELDPLVRIKIEKAKLSDERIQNNAYIRQIAREETLKEIAQEAAENMNKKYFLDMLSEESIHVNTNRVAILEISDWHYGIDITNPWNKFNPEIAEKRIAKLFHYVKEYCNLFGVNHLYIANLSDLIAGRIHYTLRLESRFDVITQVMNVSELLSEFITSFINSDIVVDYFDCVDNHSRLEPKKEDAMQLETLTRIISWYVKERCKTFIAANKLTVHDNVFGPDILSFVCKNYKVGGVHGHQDKPNQVINDISLFTQQHYDIILTAHRHHLCIDEDNNTRVCSNGSLMGTDTYSANLRKNARPTQNLIIVNDETCTEAILPIPVDDKI